MLQKTARVRKLGRAQVLLALTNIGEMKRRVADVVESLVLVLNPLVTDYDPGQIEAVCHGPGGYNNYWIVKLNKESRVVREVVCIDGSGMAPIVKWNREQGTVFWPYVGSAKLAHDALPWLTRGLIEQFPKLAQSGELFEALKMKI